MRYFSKKSSLIASTKPKVGLFSGLSKSTINAFSQIKPTIVTLSKFGKII